MVDMTEVLNTATVIAKIEAIFESMLDALLAYHPISIPIRMKTPPSSMTTSNSRCGRWREMTVSFPGNTDDESRRFGKNKRFRASEPIFGT